MERPAVLKIRAHHGVELGRSDFKGFECSAVCQRCSSGKGYVAGKRNELVYFLKTTWWERGVLFLHLDLFWEKFSLGGRQQDSNLHQVSSGSSFIASTLSVHSTGGPAISNLQTFGVYRPALSPLLGHTLYALIMLPFMSPSPNSVCHKETKDRFSLPRKSYWFLLFRPSWEETVNKEPHLEF